MCVSVCLCLCLCCIYIFFKKEEGLDALKNMHRLKCYRFPMLHVLRKRIAEEVEEVQGRARSSWTNAALTNQIIRKGNQRNEKTQSLSINQRPAIQRPGVYALQIQFKHATIWFLLRYSVQFVSVLTPGSYSIADSIASVLLFFFFINEVQHLRTKTIPSQ